MPSLTLHEAQPRRFARLVRWLLRVDPAVCCRVAAKLRSAHSHASDRQVAELAVRYWARRGAAAGLVSGVAGNPVLALPAAGADLGAMLRCYSFLTGTVGFVADPGYFDSGRWHADTLRLLVGAPAVGRVAQEVTVEAAKRGGRAFLTSRAGRQLTVTAERQLLRWVGRGLTHRALAGKLVPLIGGVVGGTWNYVELRLMGRRIIRYYFDEQGRGAS